MNKIIIALLAGITAGILIAPAKGSVTRQRMIDGFNDLVADTTGEMEAWKEEVQQEIETGNNITLPLV